MSTDQKTKDELFALCEKGNHFYGIKELDRALYYYDLAIQKGYGGLQIIQRAQRLKDQGIKPRPGIDVGKARAIIKLRQEDWRQFIFVKANYVNKLMASLKAIINCTIEKGSFKVEDTPQQINFLEKSKPVMIFPKKDANNLRPCMQYFTEMEKYYKTEIADGKKIQIPAKRKKYHVFMIFDSFTDLLVHLRRVQLFKETYYEEHRNDLFSQIDEEFKKYKQAELRLLGNDFIHWLETYSVLNELERQVPDALEYDYLQDYIADTIGYYSKLVEKEAIYRVDFIYMMLVFLEKLYEQFPSEMPDKFNFIYTKYLPCRKFDEAYQDFFTSIGQEIITEPKLHEFTNSIKPFRQSLFKK
ncbi:MAG TPA: hypothetical protein VKM55_11875 [Candidatus Lokiarchaeia archaeon]|nr:hypothetical protein [Candidatus Lokiarchaeia archaeon]